MKGYEAIAYTLIVFLFVISYMCFSLAEINLVGVEVFLWCVLGFGFSAFGGFCLHREIFFGHVSDYLKMIVGDES